MTDRFSSLVVTLEQNMREDDAADLLKAIKQLRGVAAVDGHLANIDCHVATARARTEILLRIIAMLNGEGKIQWHVP